MTLEEGVCRREGTVMQRESRWRGLRGVADWTRDIEEQWPSLKFLSLGCYYAWIFLCYNSQVLEDWAGVSSYVPKCSMYIVSTLALSTMLVLAAVFHRYFEQLLNKRLFVLVDALVASAATVSLAFAMRADPSGLMYLVSSALTGVGTALVALRIGSVYGNVSARRALMLTSVSFLFAVMVYFVCVGVPATLGVVVLSLLPLMAALFTMPLAPRAQGEACDAVEVEGRELPHGFLVRLTLAVFVFSLAASFAIGGAHAMSDLDSVTNEGSIALFVFGGVSALIFVAAGVSSVRFDLVRLYYPLILLASVSVLVIPITGGQLAEHGLLPTVVYDVFILFIWVLLSHVSHRTDLSAVQVFGWGRGASALGSTIGSVIATEIQMKSGDPTGMMILASGALIFALAVTAMIVLKEGTLDDMIAKTGGANADDFSAPLDPLAQSAAVAGRGTWIRSCDDLADKANLSKREREVLVLLSKGRTIDYIADDLGITFNTSKSHVRHVYEKTGVHTRQELLSLIEERRSSLRS